jgi:hypothetical protein
LDVRSSGGTWADAFKLGSTTHSDLNLAVDDEELDVMKERQRVDRLDAKEEKWEVFEEFCRTTENTVYVGNVK